MQVVIAKDAGQVKYTIQSTAATKLALQTQTLSARERQLLLLIDKNDNISAQAVAKLLDKVDLDQLAVRGLLTYDRSQKIKHSVQTPVNQANTNQRKINAKHERLKNHKLMNFMASYASDVTTKPKSPNTPNTIETNMSAHSVMANNQDNAIFDVPHDFEDIMIAQGLLNY